VWSNTLLTRTGAAFALNVVVVVDVAIIVPLLL
jgi:hypothetical protein